ncbi:exopolysaccharide biosynthesis polyprenyl glycosylphosphotransferase [Acidocella sp.]|uniref:exopolysaccharide biosynthesis polyprenyl glycosylphosphotransferase n=1 Tax=Acidocella sp. TaxID=50710 RepID=UPI00262719DA|nr:exopolysaccharide biosynthesis polyprenyl glycosylphosphotransferase [Acidocella sp.]
MVELHAHHDAARGGFSLPSSSRPRRTSWPLSGIQAVLDFLAIITFPICGSFLWQNTESLNKNLCFWLLLALFSILLTASHGGYPPPANTQLRARHGLSAMCFVATSFGMLILSVILGHPNILARHWVALDILITPALLIGVRAILIPILAGAACHPAEPGPLIVCYDAYPTDLRKALAGKNLPNQIAGVLYLSPSGDQAGTHEWPELPDLASLRAKLRSSRITDVVFIYHPALDSLRADENQALWEEVLAYPARIWLAFNVASNLPGLLQGKAGGCRLVPIVTDELLGSNNIIKRIFDIIAASTLLILAALPMAICALLIRISSPGPIIFSQLRTGAQGRAFRVLKFRTMTFDPARPFFQAQGNDPQTTRIGQYLRRSSLDELPQLLNVIRGDMSLVGPRPHAPETQIDGISFENAVQLYQIRHRVKPGMTGLAQIRGLRGATPVLKNLEQRLASDLEYINSWSIWLDLSILIQTVPAMLMPANAG